MREITGELWDYLGAIGYCTVCHSPYHRNGDTPYCARRHIAIERIVEDATFMVGITTNGTVRQDGACVMGRGCAAEAAKRFPGLAKTLGAFIRVYGNVPWWGKGGIGIGGDLFSFPVKHNWYEKADLGLIKKSALRLAFWAANNPREILILPRPGCGNGKLTWDQVKPVIEFLPNNVWVISKSSPDSHLGAVRE